MTFEVLRLGVMRFCIAHRQTALDVTQRLRELLFHRESMKQNETEDSPPIPPPGEGAVFSPTPVKEQLPPSLGCPSQGHFIASCRVGLVAGWAASPSCRWLHVGSGCARADWGPALVSLVAVVTCQGRICLMASVCFRFAEKCWASPQQCG